MLSQRGSDLTRSIYTLSLWIRPRECHTAAQSTLSVLHPLTTHPSVCTITTLVRELSVTHGDIKMTASGLHCKKTQKLNTATGYDSTQAIFLTFDAKLSFGKGTSVARKAE